MPIQTLREFLKLEAAGGILLIAAATLAIIADNSPLAPYYDQLLRLPFTVALGDASLSKPLLLWINDGLMAVFFLLVGLEVKREILSGHLSSKDQVALPAIAAAGGMLVPAALYAAFTFDDPQALRGWAIPAATDIAFALGIMSLLGNRVPMSLKVLLTAIAIIDDLGAIIIIALFYTDSLSLVSLVLAGLCLIGLTALNRAHVVRPGAYVVLGVLLWLCVLNSGVHATLAGVALGLAIPMKGPAGETLLEDMEHALHPWVAFMILPLFAFANAGLPILSLKASDALQAVPLAVAIGLFFGKQIGVFGGAWLAVRTGLGRMPEGASWMGIYGMSVLTGIGFTMSLFIGGLAFFDPEMLNAVRLGVLVGSVASALLGYLILRRSYSVK